MSQPADGLPIWDSNATNTVTTTPTHKTDGYVTNEIPTSAEWNYWQMLVYLWLAWAQSVIAAAQTRWFAVARPNFLAGTATQNTSSITTGSTTGIVVNGLPVGGWTAGQRITAFSVTTSAATTVITAILWLVNGSGTDTNLGTLTITNPTSGLVSSLTLGTAHTMASGESLYLEVSVTGGAGCDVRLVGVTFDVP